MPVVGGETPDNPPRPKQEIVGDATLVYRGRHVYVSFKDENNALAVAKQPETRRLTPNEVRKLEDSLPFPLLSLASRQDSDPARAKPVGLGDVVAWLMRKVGIEECESCGKRKSWLNRFVIWPRRKLP